MGKLIAHGATREEAIIRMRRGLDEFAITGIPTTIAFHQKMMNYAPFVEGKEIYTNFMVEHNLV